MYVFEYSYLAKSGLKSFHIYFLSQETTISKFSTPWNLSKNSLGKKAITIGPQIHTIELENHIFNFLHIIRL